jgi:hypothetical protein
MPRINGLSALSRCSFSISSISAGVIPGISRKHAKTPVGETVTSPVYAQPEIKIAADNIAARNMYALTLNSSFPPKHKHHVIITY